MRARGTSPSELAQALGISNQTLNNWFARGVPGRRLLAVAKLLAVQPIWLEAGEGSPLSEAELDENRRIIEMSPEERTEWLRLRNLGRTRRAITVPSYPEITWEMAGSPQQSRDETDFEDSARHCSEVNAGERGFWLSIKDSSMTSPAGVTFPEGYVILVSPDIEPADGHFVIARMPSRGEATFKQFVVDAGDRYLKPLNPSFPVRPFDDSWEIVGTVVDARARVDLFPF